MDLSNLLLNIIIYIVPTKTLLGVDVSKYFIDKVINSNHFTALSVAGAVEHTGPRGPVYGAARYVFATHAWTFYEYAKVHLIYYLYL